MRRETLVVVWGLVAFVAAITMLAWGNSHSRMSLVLPWLLIGVLLVAYAHAVRDARRRVPLAMTAAARAKKLAQKPTWLPFSRARSVHHLAMAWERVVRGEIEQAVRHLPHVLARDLREDERRMFAAITFQQHRCAGDEARAAQSLALALPGRDALSEEISYMLVRWCWNDAPKLEAIERAARLLGGALEELVVVTRVRRQQLDGALPTTWPLPPVAALRLSQLDDYCSESEMADDLAAQVLPINPYR